MEFLTVRELTTTPKKTWEKLSRDGELVITNNGKPTAIMLHVGEGEFDKTIQLIRQARMMRTLNAIWEEAEARGPLTDKEIETEIKAARAEHNLK